MGNKVLLRRFFYIQEGRCIWCGEPTYMTTVHTKDDVRRGRGIIAGQPGAGKALRKAYATLEHLLPRSLGGKDLDNVCCACLGCNTSRSSNVDKHQPHPEVLALLPEETRATLLSLVGSAPED